MHIRCPHCRAPIEVVEQAVLSDLTCPSCGSNFSLVSNETTHTHQAKVRKVAHFDLLDQVGQGAFGIVWKAHDTVLGRTVALKIPRRGQVTPEEAEYFFRDARAAAQLSHPGIVQVYEVGRDGDTIFIASEFIPGATLAEWLEAHPLSPRESAELIAHVADAIEHAHQKGVVHRDLKPGNILIEKAGAGSSSGRSTAPPPSNAAADPPTSLVPKITDFGLAKRDAGEITMTVDGQVLGTPAYMSPEQARGHGHQADARSDVYSLGVILYQLLTGELPFRGSKAMLVVQILNDEPPSPRKLNNRIPRDLETICLKAMAKDPAKRYPTAQALAQDLRRFLSGQPILARPVSAAERAWRWAKRQPVTAGLLAAVALSLVLGASVASYFALESSERASALATSEQAAKLSAAQAKTSAIEALASAADAKSKAQAAAQAEQRERQQRQDAERSAHIATALRLASESREVLSQFPQRSLLLAVESIRHTTRHGEPRLLAAEQALRDALSVVGGSPRTLAAGVDVSQVQNALDFFAALEPPVWIAARGHLDHDAIRAMLPLPVQEALRAVRLQFDRSGFPLPAHSNSDRYLLTRDQFGLKRWDLNAESVTATTLDRTREFITLATDSFYISPDGRWLVGPELTQPPATQASPANLLALRHNLQGSLLDQHRLSLPAPNARLRKCSFSPDSRWMAIVTDQPVPESHPLTKLTLWRLSPDGDPSQVLEVVTTHSNHAFDPRSRWLALESDHGCRIWDLTQADIPASERACTLDSNAQLPRPLPTDQTTFLFTPDGTRLLQILPFFEINIWDLDPRHPAPPAKTIKLVGGEMEFAVHPNGQSFFALDALGGCAVYGLNPDPPPSVKVLAPNANVALTGGPLDDRPPQTFRFPSGQSRGLCVSPSGKYLAAIVNGVDIACTEVSKLGSNPSVLLFRGAEGPTQRLIFGPDDAWIRAVSYSGDIRTWPLGANPAPASVPITLPGSPDLTWGPNQRNLVLNPAQQRLVEFNDHRVKLWTLERWHPRNAQAPVSNSLRSSIEHWEAIRSQPELAHWLFGTIRSPIALFRGQRCILEGLPTELLYVDTTPSIRFFAQPLAKGASQVRTRGGKRETVSLSGIPEVRGPRISSDGRWAIQTEPGYQIRVFDLDAPEPFAKPYYEIQTSARRTTCRLTIRGGWLLTFGPEESVLAWRLSGPPGPLEPQVVPGALPPHFLPADDLPLCKDGRWLLLESPGKGIVACDFASPSPMASPQRLTMPAIIERFRSETDLNDANRPTWTIDRSSPDGRWLAIMTKIGRFARDEPHFVELKPGGQIWSPDELLAASHSIADRIKFSPDSRWVHIHNGHAGSLYSLASSKPFAPRRPLAADDWFTHVAFSPDSRFLVTIGSAKSSPFRLWDLTLPQPGAASVILRDPSTSSADPATRIGGLVFSPDSKRLFTSDGQGKVQVWPLDWRDLVRLALQTAGRPLTDAEKQQYLSPKY